MFLKVRNFFILLPPSELALRRELVVDWVEVVIWLCERPTAVLIFEADRPREGDVRNSDEMDDDRFLDDEGAEVDDEQFSLTLFRDRFVCPSRCSEVLDTLLLRLGDLCGITGD